VLVLLGHARPTTFCENDDVPRWKIAVGLTLGFVAVLAGPSWLAWSALRTRPWDARTLKVKFDSVRFERAGLVFTYVVENRTWRDAYFRPEDYEIKPVQEPDVPLAGYVSSSMPIEFPSHAEQRMEIRMEMVNPFSASASAGRNLPPESAPPRQALQNLLTEAERAAPAQFAQDSLRYLDGFELVVRSRGVHLRFPRGW
jgi:hypothetical protein